MSCAGHDVRAEVGCFPKLNLDLDLDLAHLQQHPSSMASMPTVLTPLTLPALLTYMVNTQSSTASTTLIVCSSREEFLTNLACSLQIQHEHETDSLQQLTTPTLHNLFKMRHTHIAFCASVQALQAYLAAYGRAGTKHGIKHGKGEQRLVLVNPLSLYAPTPYFSAQGLSRTFAAVVETALRVGAKLQMVECLGASEGRGDNDDEEEEDEDENEDEDEEEVDALLETGHIISQTEDQEEDPWEQHVSILNVSARRFKAGGGDRAWAGRTIKVKRIASRWFGFERVDGLCRNEDEA
jgi:hypothetical protein